MNSKRLNRIVNIVSAIVTIIACQCIILFNLEYFGESGSGGGFIPYGFIVIVGIFWYIVFAVIVSFAIKRVPEIDFKFWRNVLLIILTAILVYYINLFIFNNVIDRDDFDGDGLSNYYEEQVGTNKFKKSSETMAYEINKIDLKNNPIVKDVVIKIIGKEDYLHVHARNEQDNYYGLMNNYLHFTIDNFGSNVPGEGVKFDFIQVEIFLYEDNLEDYCPATYVNEGDIQALTYEADTERKCYIVEIPYEFYLKDDLYRYNDDIYVGLIKTNWYEEIEWWMEWRKD